MRSDEFTKEVSTDGKEQRLGLSPEAFSYVKLQRGSNQLRSQRVGIGKGKNRIDIMGIKWNKKEKVSLNTANIH